MEGRPLFVHQVCETTSGPWQIIIERGKGYADIARRSLPFIGYEAETVFEFPRQICAVFSRFGCVMALFVKAGQQRADCASAADSNLIARSLRQSALSLLGFANFSVQFPLMLTPGRCDVVSYADLTDPEERTQHLVTTCATYAAANRAPQQGTFVAVRRYNRISVNHHRREVTQGL
ncbi:hypothetical protein Slala05_74680 [Streptomyces lavendulae subsp. lavendulae]|nr:hypothetical protein Slala05_74680 [Streptomyces lavendulae subsp. lavendulae]